MAEVKAPPIDTTDANAPDSQGIVVAAVGPPVLPVLAAPRWSLIIVPASGNYSYPMSS